MLSLCASGRTSAGVSVFLTPSNNCAATCSGAYFADDSTSTCLACDDGETSCTGNGEGDALTCGLNSKGVETYLDPSNDCVATCPPAYFGDSESLKCVQCDAGEASCLFAGPGGATSWYVVPLSHRRARVNAPPCTAPRMTLELSFTSMIPESVSWLAIALLPRSLTMVSRTFEEAKSSSWPFAPVLRLPLTP